MKDLYLQLEKQKKEERHVQWKEQQLHSKFVRETEEARSE